MSRSHMPADIQLEIINRLPVKSLIQFRSVCKPWKSFIDSSEFIAGYSAPHTQPQHLLIKYQAGYGEKSEVKKIVCFVDDDNDTFPQQKFVPTIPPLLQLLHRSRIIDSSCGLLCLAGFFIEPDNSQTELVILWNPSIRKSIVVGLPNVGFTYVIGFGVCPDTNDPKLVRITYICDYVGSINCNPYQLMVFTLSLGEWTCSCSNLPRESINFTCFQTVVGRFIYWRAYDWIDVDGKPRNLIMSFDMSSEEFREIDLPDSLADVHMSLSRLRGSLVLLGYNINFTTNKQVCDVWMMEHGDSKAFTKLFTINPPDASSVWATLGFRNSGEPIVEMKSDNKDFTTLVIYEPCSEHINDLGICGIRFSFSMYSYTPSLLLLDHDDGHIVRCGDVKR